jgi:hypothetical protein
VIQEKFNLKMVMHVFTVLKTSNLIQHKYCNKVLTFKNDDKKMKLFVVIVFPSYFKVLHDINMFNVILF